MITCEVGCSLFPFTVGLLYQQDTEVGVRACLPPVLLYNVPSYSQWRLVPVITEDSIKIYFIIQLRSSVGIVVLGVSNGDAAMKGG